jgi:hypothetical protein
MATIGERIEALAGELGAELKSKKGKYTLEKVIAERKAALSKKKLSYVARIEVDEESRTVVFSDMLKETGSGMGGGDSDTSPGFGFKKESYRTGPSSRRGTIEEQSRMFGSTYDYRFDFAAVRTRVEAIASESGYRFEPRLTN